MKKPKGWYGFTAYCDLWDCGQSNMSMPSSQLYCGRPDRNGKVRGKYDDQLKCHWNVCPKLKKHRQQKLDNVDLTGVKANDSR